MLAPLMPDVAMMPITLMPDAYAADAAALLMPRAALIIAIALLLLPRVAKARRCCDVMR